MRKNTRRVAVQSTTLCGSSAQVGALPAGRRAQSGQQARAGVAAPARAERVAMPKSFGPTTRVCPQQAQFYGALEEESLGSAAFRSTAAAVLRVGQLRPASGSVDPVAETLELAAGMCRAGSVEAPESAVSDLTVGALCTLGLEMPWRGPFVATAAGAWRAHGCAQVGERIASRVAEALGQAVADGAPRRLAAAVKLLACMALPACRVVRTLDVANQLADWASEARAQPGHPMAGPLSEALLEALLSCGDAVEAARPGTPRECLDAASAVIEHRGSNGWAGPGAAGLEGMFLDADPASSTLRRTRDAAESCVALGWRAPSTLRPDLDPRVVSALSGGAEAVSWPPSGVSAEDLAILGAPQPASSATGTAAAGTPVCGRQLLSLLASAGPTSSSSGLDQGVADAETARAPASCLFHGLAAPLLAPGVGRASAAALAACGLRASGSESDSSSGSAAAGAEVDVASALLIQRATVDCAVSHYPLHEDAAIEISRLSPAFPVGPLAVDALLATLLQQPRPGLPTAYLHLLVKQLERADMRGLGSIARPQAASGHVPLHAAGRAASGDSEGIPGVDDADEDEGAASEGMLVFVEPTPANGLRVSDGIAMAARVAFKHAGSLHPSALSRLAEWSAAHAASSRWQWLWDEWAPLAIAGSTAGASWSQEAQAALFASAAERTMSLHAAAFHDVLAASMQPETVEALSQAGCLPTVATAAVPEGVSDAFATPPAELDVGVPPAAGLPAAAPALKEAADPAALFVAMMTQVAGLSSPVGLGAAMRDLPDERQAAAADALSLAIVFQGRGRLADAAALAAKYGSCLEARGDRKSPSEQLAQAVGSVWRRCGTMRELVLLRLVSSGAMQARHAIASVTAQGRMFEPWRRQTVSALLQLSLAELRESRDAVMRHMHLVPGVGSHSAPDRGAPADEASQASSSSAREPEAAARPAGTDDVPLVGRDKGLADLTSDLAVKEDLWAQAVLAACGHVARDVTACAEGSAAADEPTMSAMAGVSLLQELLSFGGEGTFGVAPAPWAAWFAERTAATVVRGLSPLPGADAFVAGQLRALASRGWADAFPRLARDKLAPTPV